MTRRINAVLTLSIAIAVAPASVSAQQHQHQPAADQAATQHGPMAGHMMAFMPQRLLAAEGVLGLSEDQIARLQELHERAPRGGGGHMDEMMAHRKNACEMLSSDSPDWAAYQEQLAAMASGMAAMHVSMMRTAHQARSILTDGQIETMRTAGGQDAEGGASGHVMNGAGHMMQNGMMQMMMAGTCMQQG